MMNQLELHLIDIEGASVETSHASNAVTPEPGSDEALFITYTRTQDEEAFNILYNKYAPKIKGFLLRRLGDEPMAEDLTQNIFVRIMRSGHRFDPTRSFSTWSHTIASNVLKNEYRRRSRDRMYCVSDLAKPASTFHSRPSDPVQDAHDDKPNPAVATYREELRKSIFDAIDELEPQYRDPFVLHQLEGITYNEIAEKLDITVGTVKSRMHQARAFLRERLTSIHNEVNPLASKKAKTKKQRASAV